mmetsp:Transcript_62306/g.116604  ORF Transcript_62306/g.116604 Transcript_62306/m.116604 type:complete len:122 (-) Transcript_62306:308-673(-)
MAGRSLLLLLALSIFWSVGRKDPGFAVSRLSKVPQVSQTVRPFASARGVHQRSARFAVPVGPSSLLGKPVDQNKENKTQARILLLDGVLLAVAFIVNVKCASRLHGLWNPGSLWGRMLVWL